MKCFIDDCLNGSADISDVDDYIEYWHTHKELNIPLRDFLGLSETEYALFATTSKSDKEFFDDIIKKRNV